MLSNNFAVVIASDYHRGPWLADCLRSLKGCKYPVVVVLAGRYELGKIKWVVNNTSLDSFLFLHDTSEILDQSFIDDVYSHDGSVSLCDVPSKFGMYMGKYYTDILRVIHIPEIKTKHDAVLNESHWTHNYASRARNVITLFSDLDLPAKHRFEVKHGRNNLVLENDYLRKYKGTWSSDMIHDD